MIKLCVFDLDGTVLDTVETIGYYGNYALTKHGIAEIDVNMYKYLAGNGVVNLIKNMLVTQNALSDENFDRVFKDYSEAYNKDVTYKSKIFDGMKETLDKLKESGIKIAIVSNKPDFASKTVINSLFGEGYFDFVFGQQEGVALKPDPVMVLKIMSDLGIKKEECVYVGDTSTDMKTGKNAGVFTVGVLWGFRERDELMENGADLIIEKPIELYNYISESN